MSYTSHGNSNPILSAWSKKLKKLKIYLPFDQPPLRKVSKLSQFRDFGNNRRPLQQRLISYQCFRIPFGQTIPLFLVHPTLKQVQGKVVGVLPQFASNKPIRSEKAAKNLAWKHNRNGWTFLSSIFFANHQQQTYPFNATLTSTTLNYRTKVLRVSQSGSAS